MSVNVEEEMLAVLRGALKKARFLPSHVATQLVTDGFLQLVNVKDMQKKERMGETDDAIDLMINTLIECTASSRGVYTALVRALREGEYESLANLADGVDNMGTLDNNIYINMLQIQLPKLLDIDLTALLPHLRQRNLISDDEMSKIRITKQNMGETDAILEMLPIVWSRKPEWFTEFSLAMKACDQRHADIIAQIEPKLAILRKENEITSTVAEVTQANRMTATEVIEGQVNDLSSDELLQGGAPTMSVKCNINEDNYKGDCQNLNLTRVCDDNDCSDSQQVDSDRPEALMTNDGPYLRDYQKELVEPAMRGCNTIIVAPTNTGKTVVAIYLAKDHLEKMRGKKIIFMVPRVPLVSQQHQQFEKYLSQYSMQEVVGKTGVLERLPFHLLIQNTDIVFMTPQILADSLKTNKSLLNKISLMIFDECHHAIKNSPYNQVMKEYIDAKYDKMSPLPQVVGLSATLGTGKKVDALEHMLGVAANLDAQCVSTVKTHLKNLHNYIHHPLEAYYVVKCRENDLFRQLLDDFIEVICEKLRKAVGPPPSGSEKQFANFLSSLREMKISLVDAAKKRFCDACIRFMEVLHWALLLNNDCESSLALKLIDDNLKDPYFTNKEPTELEQWLLGQYTQRRKQLEKICENETYKNQKLAKLKQVLMKQSTEDDSSRIMVFVHKRDLAQALTLWAKEQPPLVSLNPQFVLGERSMTDDTRKRTLADFRSGVCRLLFSTNVLEEGHDVPECACVICYEYVTNEIARIQTRGRGRAENSQFMLITESEKSRDDVNAIRERLMLEGTQQLSELSPQRLQKEVRERQMKEREARQTAVQATAKQSSVLQLQLKCASCSTIACTTADIRLHDVHRVAVSRQFYSACQIEKQDLADGHGYKKIGNLYCKKCGQGWGNFVIIGNGIEVALIKVSSFECRNAAAGIQKVYRKWQQVPATLKELSSEDRKVLLEMMVERNGTAITDSNNDELLSDSESFYNLVLHDTKSEQKDIYAVD